MTMKLFLHSLLLILCIAPMHATEKSAEFIISSKNTTHLPLLMRLKHTIQHKLAHAFSTKKQLRHLIANGNVVVKFYRPGCKYCTYIDPILEQVQNKFIHDVTFISVNLNAQSMDYKKAYNFEYVPTVVYFKNGNEVLRHDSENGAITQEKIEKHVETAFGIKTTTQNSIRDLQASTAVLTKTAAPHCASKLASQERSCLALLISLAESHITELSAQLNAFFDIKGNKDPYKVHVEKFYQILMNIDKAIASPLKAEIKATKKAEYKKLLELIESIVQDLHTNLLEAHTVFKKNTGKDALVAAAALGNLKKDADARRPKIEHKLKELHALLLTLDAGLANEIDAIQKSLPKIFESEMSNLVLLARLKQRLQM